MLRAGACSCRRRRAARHAERLHEAWTQRNGRGGKRPAGRGPEAQAARRALEREVRKPVVSERSESNHRWWRSRGGWHGRGGIEGKPPDALNCRSTSSRRGRRSGRGANLALSRSGGACARWSRRPSGRSWGCSKSWCSSPTTGSHRHNPGALLSSRRGAPGHVPPTSWGQSQGTSWPLGPKVENGQEKLLET
jgi:hypothetical protein